MDPNYPKHPDTILIENEFYPEGLTEHMVWKHNQNHQSDLFKQLKGKRVLLFIKTDAGNVLRRKDEKGDEFRIKRISDIEDLNSGRAMEFHIVADSKTDISWVDLDPKEKFNFEDVKQVVKDIVPIMKEVIDTDEIQIKYSSDRGFHIIAQHEERNIDELRQILKEQLDEYAESNEKLTTDITKDPTMMRLDVSTLHESGSIRATWSLNVDTGLVSIPLELEELDDFEKSSAVIEIPQKLIFYPFKEDPNSTSGQMRWRMRDPDSFISGSIITWKYWEGIHESDMSFIVGKLLKPYGELAVQAIRFNRAGWNAHSAAEWWKRNYYKFDKLWVDKDWDL